MRARIGSIVMLLPLMLLTAGLGTPASFASHADDGTQLGGFEIDGDLLYPHSPAIAGATTDWEVVGDVVRVNDSFAPASDSIFTGGSKEQDPDGWVFTDGSVPGKDDLTRLYFASDVEAPTSAFLFLAFERLGVSGNGDVHVNFELNQSSSTVTNSKGTVIPQRTAGDLLVVYDYDGGTASTSVEIEVRLWIGDALSGEWGPDIGSENAVGDVNGSEAVARPAAAPFGGGTVAQKRFGEAAIDLLGIYPNLFANCLTFTNLWAKTRASGESFDSALKDRTAPKRIVLSGCPELPSALEVTKTADEPSVESGEVIGYTITVTNTSDVDAVDVVLTDNLPADPGTSWEVDGGTAAASCTITGRELTCEIGDMPAHTSRTVHLSSGTSDATCGRVSNTATVGSLNAGSDTSDEAVVEVVCPGISIVKTATPVSGAAGDPVTYSYVVTNTGTTTLFDVSVDDDKLGHIGDIAVLEAGESVTLTKASTLGSVGVTNIGCAEGTDELGARVRACDDATVTVVLGGRLAETAGGKLAPVGFGFVLLGLLLAGMARRKAPAIVAPAPHAGGPTAQGRGR